MKKESIKKELERNQKTQVKNNKEKEKEKKMPKVQQKEKKLTKRILKRHYHLKVGTLLILEISYFFPLLSLSSFMDSHLIELNWL